MNPSPSSDPKPSDPSPSDAAQPDSLARWIDSGLYVPADDAAGERREVIEVLIGEGMTPEDFEGVTAGDLLQMVSRRLLQPGRRLGIEEARAASSFESADFERVARAAGYPEGYEYTADDVEAFDQFAAALTVFSEDELFPFVRALAASMGRVADAATALFRIDVSPDLEERGAREVDWARSNIASVQLIDPLLVAARTFLLRELGLSADRSDQARDLIGDTSNSSTLRLAVGFVDLVGYTSIAAEMNPDALGRFVRDFEERAHDAVTANGGRVVKLIGDEVMFVTVEPRDACAAALALIDAFADDDATPSGGIATGEIIARGGDYYGSKVNLAARIAALAVGGEVLVDSETAAEVRADGGDATLTFEPAGRRMLKGFADPVALLSIVREQVVRGC